LSLAEAAENAEKGRGQKAEVRSQKSGVRSQGSGVSRQKVGGLESEDRRGLEIYNKPEKPKKTL